MFYREHKRSYAPLDYDNTATKQAFKDECDINTILHQYSQTGMINHIRQNAGSYIDLPDEMDYQSAMNIVLEGQAAFAKLPAKVRDSFNNDPARFLAAFDDPSGIEQLRALGVVAPARPDDNGPDLVEGLPSGEGTPKA